MDELDWSLLESESFRLPDGLVDTSPLDPSPGVWLLRSEWAPLPGESRPYLMDSARPAFEVVNREGLQLSCLRGVLRVWVVGPDGVVHCTYDRRDNLWRRHTELARSSA